MARLDTNTINVYSTIHLENLKNTTIFVVDMINGFCKEGAMSDNNIMDIIPNITKLLTKYAKKNQFPYFFVDSHEESAIEFNSFPKHCIKDTYESEIVSELVSFVNNDYIIYKNSTNGFHELNEYLDNLKKDNTKNIIITGCCTDICVMQFTLTLKTWLNANDMDIDVIIPLDCVDTYDSGDEYHPANKFNMMAITLMEQAGVKIYRSIT
ncbi:MAG: isochorismatase family cysteine hydrolase [Coprobacillaceae bacterium]